MNATAISDECQAKLPLEVVQAADLKPGDQVEWRFEGGEIHGRKLRSATVTAPATPTKAEVLRALESSPLRFTAHWNQLREETR